jgi:hypothetical protein
MKKFLLFLSFFLGTNLHAASSDQAKKRALWLGRKASGLYLLTTAAYIAKGTYGPTPIPRIVALECLGKGIELLYRPFMQSKSALIVKCSANLLASCRGIHWAIKDWEEYGRRNSADFDKESSINAIATTVSLAGLLDNGQKLKKQLLPPRVAPSAKHED